MTLIDHTYASKIGARLRKASGNITSRIDVTVSEHCPESIQKTGFLPRTKGWKVMKDIPLRVNGRKDYIKFLQETNYKEVWIRLSTIGGPSRVYVR